MEQKFQTSFIPKRQNSVSVGSIPNSSLQRPKTHGTSLFMLIAVLIFIISIGGVAGAYFWKLYLKSANEIYKKELVAREKQFNLDLIEKLKRIDFQIDTAKTVIKDHLAVSKLFEFIQKMTVDGVRFSRMDFKGDTGGINMTLNLEGYGKNLPTVAFQSDVFAKLADYGLSKVIKNPIMSDPTINSNGTVSFRLSAEVDGSSLLYNQLIEGDNSDANP